MGTQLFEENKQLRELIASLGGDSSSVPSSSLSSISPLSLNTSKTAKRVKRECRVDLPANSLESAVGAQNTPIGRSDHCTTLDLAFSEPLSDDRSHSEATGSSTNDLDLSRIDSTELFRMCAELNEDGRPFEALNRTNHLELEHSEIPTDVTFDLVGFVFDC